MLPFPGLTPLSLLLPTSAMYSTSKGLTLPAGRLQDLGYWPPSRASVVLVPSAKPAGGVMLEATVGSRVVV